MAGTFTQSRYMRDPWNLQDFKSGQPGTPQSTTSLYEWVSSDYGKTFTSRSIAGFGPLPYQKTTSFRSGSRWGAEIEDPVELIRQNETHNRYPFDQGHEFSSVKLTFKASHYNVTLWSKSGQFCIKGPLVPQGLPAFWNKYMFSTPLPKFDITKGSHALRATMPTKSAANLAQALAELLVDVPRLPLHSLKEAHNLVKDSPKVIGEEFLNQVFGWVPTVNDVVKICRAISKSGKILEQYERDSGRQVRRQYKYPLEIANDFNSDTTSPGGLTNYLLSDYTAGVNAGFYEITSPQDPVKAGAWGQLTQSVQTTTSYWFSGAWMYHADEGNTLIDKMISFSRKADKLLGTKISLETLWELAPWSWMIDWFVNIGDIIAINNHIADDNLVLRYGYLTRKSKRTITSAQSGIRFTTWKPTPIVFQGVLLDTQRVRATPYGFGINTNSLSEMQWAILAALGLTRAPKKLWWG